MIHLFDLRAFPCLFCPFPSGGKTPGAEHIELVQGRLPAVLPAPGPEDRRVAGIVRHQPTSRLGRAGPPTEPPVRARGIRTMEFRMPPTHGHAGRSGRRRDPKAISIDSLCAGSLPCSDASPATCAPTRSTTARTPRTRAYRAARPRAPRARPPDPAGPAAPYGASTPGQRRPDPATSPSRLRRVNLTRTPKPPYSAAGSGGPGPVHRQVGANPLRSPSQVLWPMLGARGSRKGTPL